MIAALLAFAAASVVVVLLPGPDTLVVLRSLLRGGRRRAALTAAGILSGLAVWIAAAAFGASAVLRASHDGYLALRVAGGVYLVVLGVRALTAHRRDALSGGGRGGVLGTGYWAGLATDLLNPKVGVFFITLLPGFVPRHAAVATASLALGAVFLLETAVYFAVMVSAADRVTRALNDPRVRRRMDRTTAAVLIGFGLRLAVEG